MDFLQGDKDFEPDSNCMLLAKPVFDRGGLEVEVTFVLLAFGLEASEERT